MCACVCLCLAGCGVSFVMCGVFFVQEALRRVKRSFKACPDLNAPMDEESDEDMGESDDELMATATRLSLRCPLGLVSGVMFCAVLPLCFQWSCIWSVCSAVLIYSICLGLTVFLFLRARVAGYVCAWASCRVLARATSKSIAVCVRKQKAAACTGVT